MTMMRESIEFYDAHHGDGDTWEAIADVKPTRRLLSATGFVVAEDDDTIVIAHTYDAATESVAGRFNILKATVVSRVPLGSAVQPEIAVAKFPPPFKLYKDGYSPIFSFTTVNT